jgi:vacuolar-type H+-ATPase subunit I/STV1
VRNLWTWKVKVTKVKAIYHVLNMLHSEGKNFVGECWLPTVDMGKVQMILNKSAVRYLNSISASRL